ncbi:MAG TPA: tetratricopeptide repeat protein [Polyangia bacterium]
MPQPTKRYPVVVVALLSVALAAFLVVRALGAARSLPDAPASGQATSPEPEVTPPVPAPPVVDAAAPPLLPARASAVADPLPRRAPRPAAAAALGEDALLARIDELGPSNLPLTVQLAREALARFPDSPRAPEFAMNLTKSLVHLGRIDEAREAAREMLRKYPDSPFTGEVERHLLTNPPNPPR